jgi:hypothetical protein
MNVDLKMMLRSARPEGLEGLVLRLSKGERSSADKFP